MLTNMLATCVWGAACFLLPTCLAVCFASVGSGRRGGRDCGTRKMRCSGKWANKQASRGADWSTSYFPGKTGIESVSWCLHCITQAGHGCGQVERATTSRTKHPKSHPTASERMESENKTTEEVQNVESWRGKAQALECPCRKMTCIEITRKMAAGARSDGIIYASCADSSAHCAA